MADETPSATVVDAPAPASSKDTAEPVQTNGHDTTITKENEENAGRQTTTEVKASDGNTTEVAEDLTAVELAVDSTAASGKKEKRKSVSAVPEHKTKKLNKKKSMVALHLDCKPGEHYWARLKGYPPWPAIICDEQMLPESLLASRPVSTARPDGSLRDDFKEGGKNAKERTFPVMFLSTNEFSWMVNTQLTPLDPNDVKEKPKGKMTKALADAYQLAAEQHPIEHYKKLLHDWQEETQRIAEERAEADARAEEEKGRLAKEAEEAAVQGNAEDGKKEKKKKAPRKSKVADGDVAMEDAEVPKSSKKRKKDAESDAEGAKPKKTPKVTKLNAPKTPGGETPAKKSSSKPKKKVSAPKAEEAEEEAKPQMTEAEKLQQREKAVLYLRHRLQKGFLSRDQAPREDEMSTMADFFTQLENYDGLEPSIIRTTKIHKVLKAIVKLVTIPKDEEFGFKRRSSTLLEVWNKRMEGEGEAAGAGAVEPKGGEVEASEAPTTNGEAKVDGGVEVNEGAKKTVEENGVEEVANRAEENIEQNMNGDAEMPDAVKEPENVPKEKAAVTDVDGDTKDEADVGDVSMQTAPEEPAVSNSAEEETT